MRIVQENPPLIDAIDAAFNVRGKPILFAWGDIIYNPMGVEVPPELVAHEKVHGKRQLAGVPMKFEADTGITGWWRRYIVDPEFRLAEEIPAHVAEFGALCGEQSGKWVSQRNMKRTYAAHVAKKLASSLYGNLITVAQARKILLQASRPK